MEQRASNNESLTLTVAVTTTVPIVIVEINAIKYILSRREIFILFCYCVCNMFHAITFMMLIDIVTIFFPFSKDGILYTIKEIELLSNYFIYNSLFQVFLIFFS